MWTFTPICAIFCRVKAKPEFAREAANDGGTDLSTWLTAQEAADLLRVSAQTVKNWRDRGLITSRTRPGTTQERRSEITVYDPHELARLPRKLHQPIATEPGEVAARAFEMFDEGKTVRAIVVALRRPPAEVEALYDQWKEGGGDQMIIHPAAYDELVRFVGLFPSVEVLVARVRELVGKTIEATVDDSATDAQIERAIGRALDDAEKGKAA